MRLYTQSQQSPLQTLGTRHIQGGRQRLRCRHMLSCTHTHTLEFKKSDAQPWAPKQTNTKGHINMASVFGKNLVATIVVLLCLNFFGGLASLSTCPQFWGRCGWFGQNSAIITVSQCFLDVNMWQYFLFKCRVKSLTTSLSQMVFFYCCCMANFHYGYFKYVWSFMWS